MARKKEPATKYYFVDEAGDPVLFSRKGQFMVGEPGCSRFFILGLLDVEDPQGLSSQLEALRNSFLSDSFFQKIPSMQLEQKKTAFYLHAKDDIAEVRWEVFKLLNKAVGLRFLAIVTDKMQVYEYVRQRNLRDPNYHYTQNELYDYLVRRLFKNLLHKDSDYHIVFAKRGKSDRTKALMAAISAARNRFCNQWGKTTVAPINIQAYSPLGVGGLQAVDYYLWSLQRLYEWGEDRYINYLQGSVHLVNDIDDTRVNDYGVYYTQKNPVTKKGIDWRNEIKKPGI